MKTSLKQLVLLAHLVAAVNCDATCYDHQNTDYKAQFYPTECKQKCSVTPFFSPDHSVDVYLDLIQTATETIDIYTPGMFLILSF